MYAHHIDILIFFNLGSCLKDSNTFMSKLKKTCQTFQSSCNECDYTTGLYVGTKDVSHFGRECHRWDEHPHIPHHVPEDGGHHNYCRAPSSMGDQRPWCYTFSGYKRRQYCDVPTCQAAEQISELLLQSVCLHLNTLL